MSLVDLPVFAHHKQKRAANFFAARFGF